MPVKVSISKDTKRWTRSTADEHAVANGCYFDIEAAERVRMFFSKFLRHSKGKWGGEPFTLLDWQWNDIIAPLFGWKRPNKTRRYRRSYIEIPKKNGKSTISSGLAIYMLVGDGEKGAEVYCGAADRAQAGIVFNESANMVESSPSLSKRIELVKSVKRMVCPTTYSFLQALSADVKTKEGLNAHFVVFDELHVQPNRKMFDTLWYAGASREQPLSTAITTAGHDKTGICWEQHEYAEKVITAKHYDDEFFGYIAAATDQDDWTAESTWKKANPSFEVTIKPEEMAAACREAQNEPAKINSFKRYRLNIWTAQETLWIVMDDWDKCGITPIIRSNLAGRRCHLGLDLAKTSDLTALALTFPNDDGAWDVLPFFWMPKLRALEKEKKDKVPYSRWAEAGFITLTEGNTTDYRAVREFIVELAREFEIVDGAYDPWNASHLITELTEDEGMNEMFFEFRQNIQNFNEPSKYFETLVQEGKLHHGGHPILRWNAENVTVITDVSGNIRPVKPTHGSPKRVDGVIATIMSLGRGIVNPNGGESYGAGEDLLIL